MLKLTRLNRQLVAVNPDHISWADASPDTTLFMIGGEKLIVRETLDELIEAIIEFRRLVRQTPAVAREVVEGELAGPDVMRAIRRSSMPPRLKGL